MSESGGVTFPSVRRSAPSGLPLSPSARAGFSRRESRSVRLSTAMAASLAAASAHANNSGSEAASGAWLPFNNHMGAEHLLPGPNGGGAVGLPNFAPMGHPALANFTASSASPTSGSGGGMNARAQHASLELEQLLTASNKGVLAGMSGPIGLEGRPYISLAERNRAEARNVSEATMLLASLARDAAQHGTPRTIEKHNTTLAQLRVFAAGGSANTLAKSLAANPPAGGSSGAAHLHGGAAGAREMPTFNVEAFMRSNQSTTSEQDRLGAADVLRLDPADRSEAQIASLAAFLASVSFFAPLSEPLRRSIAAQATLRTLRKDELVYREGDDSVFMYVVLSGSVGTRVRDFAPQPLASSSAAAGSAGFIAVTSGVGELFGAETLGGSDERLLSRPQTKVSLEARTELLQIDMAEFKTLSRAAQSKEAQEKMAFVAALPLFEKCSMRELHRIASAMQPLAVAKSTLIVKQGDLPSDCLYFIVKGTVRVVHKVYTKVQQVEREPPRPSTQNHSTGRHTRATSEFAPPASSTRRSRRSKSHASEFGHSDPEEEEDDAFPEHGEAKEQDARGLGAASSGDEAARAGSSADAVARAASHSRSVSMASNLGRDRESSPNERAQSRHTSRSGGGGGGGGGGAYKYDRAQAFNAHRARSAADGTNREWGASSTLRSSSSYSPTRTASLVAVTRTVLKPQLLDLGRLGPKWFFGELGVLRDEPRSASVYAETACELLVLSRDDVFARLPAWCIRYLEDYASRFYAPHAELKEQWRQQQRWDAFKLRIRAQARSTASIAESAAGFSRTLQELKH